MSRPGAIWSRLPSVRAMLLAALAAQALIGAAMLSGDLWRALDPGGAERLRGEPTRPVSPGDQLRPFSPAAAPSLPGVMRPDAPVPMPATTAPDRFVVEEGELDGAPALLVSGPLEEGAAARFRAFLDSGPPPPIVALHSPGGSVREALEIGRAIREAGLSTVIAPGAACLSACPYVLAGGVERRVSGAGWVGLHQHYYDQNTILPAFMAVSAIQAGQADTLAYLDEMGIDPAVMVYGMRTPPQEIYILVEAELLKHRLATAMLP